MDNGLALNREQKKKKKRKRKEMKFISLLAAVLICTHRFVVQGERTIAKVFSF
jgi:hypothetical protein